MIPFDYLDLFDPDRLQIPQLATTSTRFFLRLLMTAYHRDPRCILSIGYYTQCVPCEMCYRRPSQVREVKTAVTAIAQACKVLGELAAKGQFGPVDRNWIGAVQHDILAIVRYFGADGFDEEAYERDRCVPGVREAVTMLRCELDLPTRLMLEEELAHRPELLQTNPLDTILLWWHKRQGRKKKRGNH